MDILMVYPKPDNYKKPRFGFSYEMMTIATILSEFHRVRIKDFSCESFDEEEFVEYVRREHIEIAFIECDSYALKRSQNIINANLIINALNSYVTTIAYGNYCYITKRNFGSADHTITSNNINCIIDCINRLDGSVFIPHIGEYDKIPYIDRTLLRTIPYYKDNARNTLLQTSKGCENTCVFCQRKGWQNCYVTHSDDYVLGEIHTIRTNGFQNIWITDENFTFNLNRAKRLLSEIIQEKLHNNIRFFISSWANIDEEFLNIAKQCNVRIISFGIESGNADILRFYKKNINVDRVPHIIQYANSIGIFTVGNFIIGAPMETQSTIEETFELIRRCGFDQINIKNLDYMIGSSLYESLPDELKKEDHVFACFENGLNSFRLDDIKQQKDAFLSDYYSTHRTILEEKIHLYGTPY